MAQSQPSGVTEEQALHQCTLPQQHQKVLGDSVTGHHASGAWLIPTWLLDYVSLVQGQREGGDRAWNEVGAVWGKEWADWVQEGEWMGGARAQYPTPFPGSICLHKSTRTSTSNITVVDPNCAIEAAGAHPRGKEQTSPYSDAKIPQWITT